MNTNWKIWLHGLLAYVATGAATTAGGTLSAMAFSPKMVWSPEFWATVGGAAVFGGIGGALLYLKQSPIVKPPTP